MRSFLIRLTIALVAFIVGVTAASIFGGLFGARSQHRCVESDAYVAPPPMPVEHHSCPMHRFDTPAPPESPAPPFAPEPPKFEKNIRIHVRTGDGTVNEVEIKTEKDAEQ